MYLKGLSNYEHANRSRRRPAFAGERGIAQEEPTPNHGRIASRASRRCCHSLLGRGHLEEFERWYNTPVLVIRMPTQQTILMRTLTHIGLITLLSIAPRAHASAQHIPPSLVARTEQEQTSGISFLPAETRKDNANAKRGALIGFIIGGGTAYLVSGVGLNTCAKTCNRIGDGQRALLTFGGGGCGSAYRLVCRRCDRPT